MTRAHHVTHGRTAERLDKIRKLVTALQARQLTRDEIGTILEVGPSGVRKYLADLAGKVELDSAAGEQVCRLAMSAEEASAYLAGLSAQAPTSGRKGRISELTLAERDPRRHLHIMLDDEYHQVRVSRGIPAHEPVHAAFWRMGSAEQRV